MSRVWLHRPARALPPAVPDQLVMLPPVPQDSQQGSAGSSAMTLLLPIMSSVALAAYMVSNGKPVLIIVGVSFVLCSVGGGVLMSQRTRSGRRKTKDRQRARYLDHLAEVRQTARQVAADQRLAAAWVYPSPERLWAIARRRRRVWERRPADPDFLHVRLGLGEGPLAAPVQMSPRMDPLADYDPQILAAAQRHAARLGRVGRQPAVIDLGSAGVVSLTGPADLARSLARALVLQVAVLHACDDLGLIVHTGGESSWEWTKWLPHTHEPEVTAAAGVAPLVAAEIADLSPGLEGALEQGRAARQARRTPFAQARADRTGRRLLVVLDSYDPTAEWARLPVVGDLLEEAGPETGITVVCLPVHESCEPSGTRVRARVDPDGGLTVEGPGAGGARDVERPVADQLSAGFAEMIGRTLAPLRLSEEPERLLSRTIALAQMLGVADLADFDPTTSWLPPEDEDVLRVPVGLAFDGEPVLLDLKESAAGGMGPHGLVVGATGSGKSELLRTLVTALTMTHSPELLSLILIDFKGGATFAGLTELPHVAGLITNLADDLTLVERVRAALHGEQQRRQMLLRQAGNADSLRDYQMRRAAGYLDATGKPLEPLPYLLIVVDEFGELLSQRNDFIDLFVQIGRVGRSLGMHLLLATQRLDEGRLRGLESHLSYRICLRTFTSGESRAVIGTTDAYELPPIPGSAFLKSGDSGLLRFRVACMSGPYDGPEPATMQAPAEDIVPFALRGTEPEQDTAPDEKAGGPARPVRVSEPTALHVAAKQLARFGQPVHQVWLPPLPAVVPLDALLGPLSLQPGRGWQASLWPGRGRLTFPVGLVDLPFQQRQEPFLLDFARTHGNLAVIGAPQSGKSTFLRTLMLSAMLTHTPDEIRFYCLDFGGSTLTSFGRTPHVGTVAGRRDPELAARLIAEMARIVAAREKLFGEHGIHSPAAFRGLGAAGLPAGTYTGEILVIIDNWGAVRADLEDADAAVADLAFRGLGVGVHVVLTANRWADVRMNVRDGFGARLELRLNDPTESEVSRPLSRQLPVGVPGRGLAPPGLLFHAVAPRLDGRDTIDDLTDAQDEVITKITASWSGTGAQAVQLLPRRVRADDLGVVPAARHGIPIGLADTDLRPVFLDLSDADPHLVVLGDAGAGKSALLRTLMRGLASRHRSDEIRFMLVDYRRSLLDVLPDDYIGAYAGDSIAAREYATHLASQLAGRLPPAGITARELRARRWWDGPDLYLVIDDYDLVTTTPPSPLAVVADYIPQAREIGLHVVLARRVSGMSRVTAADQLLTRIRDLGTSGIVMSGDPREGVVLGGERALERPPGRGVLVGRGGSPVVVQVALSDGEG
jgi:S-DNA-T family DNA segregation ATPase FtsK/SpoIIIE